MSPAELLVLPSTLINLSLCPEGSKSTFKLMSAVALLDTSGAETQWKDILARYAMLPRAEDVPLSPEEIPGTTTVEESQPVAPRAAPAPGGGGNPDAMAALGPMAQGLAESMRVRIYESKDYRAAFQSLLEKASVLLGQVAAMASQGTGAPVLTR